MYDALASFLSNLPILLKFSEEKTGCSFKTGLSVSGCGWRSCFDPDMRIRNKNMGSEKSCIFRVGKNLVVTSFSILWIL